MVIFLLFLLIPIPFINFLVISVVIFLVIRAMVSLQKELGLESDESEEPAPQPSDEVVLLTEIRDLMKERQID